MLEQVLGLMTNALCLILELTVSYAKEPQKPIVNPAGTNPVTNHVLRVAATQLQWDENLVMKKNISNLSYCGNAKKKDQKVCTMSQKNADEYCKSLRKRLPTTRELAQWAQARGAMGIMEPDAYRKLANEPKNARKVVDFYPIYKTEGDRVVVDFYFNTHGYHPLKINFENYWIWSSLVNPKYPGYGYNFYAKDGHIGDPYYSSDNRNVAVLCVTPN